MWSDHYASAKILADGNKRCQGSASIWRSLTWSDLIALDIQPAESNRFEKVQMVTLSDKPPALR